MITIPVLGATQNISSAIGGRGVEPSHQKHPKMPENWSFWQKINIRTKTESINKLDRKCLQKSGFQV
jgi:hypothetical protein